MRSETHISQMCVVTFHVPSLKVTVEWVAILFLIRDVISLSLNFVPDWQCSRFFSPSRRNSG